MSGRSTLRWCALLSASALGVAGCGGDDTPKTELGPKEWKASVYESVLREIALPAAQQSMPDDDKPVVFLATADGSGIGLEVQTIIARDLKDEADLRIADSVGDVVLDGEDDKPVKDDGLLVTVTPLPDDEPNRVELTVALYFDETDQQRIDVALQRAAAAWTLTTSPPTG